MKQLINIYTIIGIIVVLSLAIAFFVLAQTAKASVGNLQVYQGSTEVIREGKSVAGKTGLGIQVNDTLKIAPDSTVAIVLKDSSVVRLEAGSEIEIEELSYQGQKIKQASFKLKFGRLWSRVAPLENGGQFDVETPTVVAAIRGTSFNATYKADLTGIYVYQKKLTVSLKTGQSQIVNTGLLLQMKNDKLEEDFLLGPKIPDTSFFDSWIRFNQEEDDKICRENRKTPGCEDYFPQAVPTDSPQPSPTSSPEVLGTTAPTPTKTLKPTITPSPQPTSDPPTPNPTSTPTPEPTPTPTLKPTPTPSEPPYSTPYTTPYQYPTPKYSYPTPEYSYPTPLYITPKEYIAPFYTTPLYLTPRYLYPTPIR